MKKRIASMIMAFVLCLLLMPVSAMADEQESTQMPAPAHKS